jgi:hypothetical protein
MGPEESLNGLSARPYFKLLPRLERGENVDLRTRAVAESSPMDEQKLIERLRLIEAVFAKAATAGERVAAGRARERILERLLEMERDDPATEYRFTMSDMYARRVFVTLCRRYGLKPYRYKRQRYTTVMVRVSPRFVDETLWPQFEQLSETLHSYLSEVTDRVVGEVLQADSSEATVIEEGGALPSPEAVVPSKATEPAAQTRASVGARASVDRDAQKAKRRERRRDRKRKKKRKRR